MSSVICLTMIIYEHMDCYSCIIMSIACCRILRGARRFQCLVRPFADDVRRADTGEYYELYHRL